MPKPTRLAILVFLAGGVAAFVMPYLLPPDRVDAPVGLVLTVGLFFAAYVVAVTLDRIASALDGPRRTPRPEAKG